MWGWLRAIVQGIVQPLLSSYNDYRRGRVAQQRDDLQATVEVERDMAKAVDAYRARPVVVDADVLRERIAQAHAERERRAKSQ